jgi:hypothetical protein
MGGKVLGMLILAVVVFAAFAFALYWWDPANVAARQVDIQRVQREKDELAPLWLTIKRMVLASAGTGLSLASLLVPTALALWLLREVAFLWPRKGAYAAPLFGIKVGDPVGSEKVAVAGQISNGRQKVLTSTVRALTKDDDRLALPAPEPPQIAVELDPVEVLAPELEAHPHKLVIAESRFGKTNLAWALIRRYQAALPGCEFLILSIIASKWPDMHVVSTAPQMLEAMTAVEQELIRRDALLKRLKITDVHNSDALSAIFVVFDEVETSLELLSSAQRGEFRRLVTRYVNTVGNVKGGLISLSQTGSRDILPKSILANADLYMGRCGTYVPESFKIQDPALTDAISKAEKGHWYSYRHRAWFTAPEVKPPRSVQLWAGYTPTLQLTADGEADNIDGIDLPSTLTEQELLAANGTVRDALLALGYSKSEAQQAIRELPDEIVDQDERILLAIASFSGTRYTVEPPSTVQTVQTPGGGPNGRYIGIVYRVPGQDVPLLDTDESLHRKLWAAILAGNGLKKSQMEAGMGYEGGTGFYLAREIRRLGQIGKLPWMEERP